MNNKQKILVIGVDGGTWTVLRPALDGGHMPYLKELIDAGASGILESTLPAITPAAWGSFQTGTNPGANGVFDFSYWDKEKKKNCYVSSNCLTKTVWEIAGDAGKRVGTINVPMTYPPRPINGYTISGILTPSMDSDFTYPGELKGQLADILPDYHVFNLQNVPREYPAAGQLEDFVGQMAAIVRTRARSAEFIINKEPLDLFMVHFQASDVFQHMLWGYLDAGHESFDPVKHKYVLGNFYRELDECIARVRRAFAQTSGGDFLTLIVSDHGFERHRKRFNLGNWLCQEGFMEFDRGALRGRMVKKFTKRLKLGRLFRPFMAKQTLSKIEKRINPNVIGVDLDRSRVLPMGMSGEGFVYLLQDDPSQRNRTTEAIIEKIGAVRDPDNNSPIVKAVYRKEDIYHGDHVDIMPDLIIETAAGYSCTGACRPGRGLFDTVRFGEDNHAGKHHKNGIVVAAGEGVRQQDSVSARLIDIAPTMLYYLGIAVGGGMDGRVVEELFADDFKNKLPPVRQADSPLSTPKENRKTYSKDDEEKIERRLKDLGYM